MAQTEYIPNPNVKVTLSWTGSGSALLYRVQLERYEGGSWTGTQNLTATGESRVIYLRARTKYRFRVKERGPFTEGDWSDWLEFTPQDEAPSSDLGTDDLNPGLVAGVGYIDITWSDHPDLGGVAVYASTQGTPSYEDFREFVPRPGCRFRFPCQTRAYFLLVAWDWAGRRIGELSLEGSPVGLGTEGMEMEVYGGQFLLLEADMEPGAAGDMTRLEGSFVLERVEVFLKEATTSAQKIKLAFGEDEQGFTLGTAVDLYEFREGILFSKPYPGGTMVSLSAPGTNTEAVKVKVRVWGRVSGLVARRG